VSWWGWVIAGAILFGAELAGVNAQFYLVFIGSAAIVVGLITAMTSQLAPAAQWAIFAIVTIVSMVTFRSQIYRRFRGQPPAAHEPAGGVITLPTLLGAGDSCQVEHDGTYWTVRNDSVTPLPAGTRVRVSSVQGLTLLVRPDV
jgi:membrane protein implicated in regulation of membrane protease activity